MLPCYTCGCAHPACWALRFLGFLPVLRPPSGSCSPCSSGSSSPLWFPTFAMESPLRGRGSFVLDRNEGLVSPFGSEWSVSWLGLEPLYEASLRTLFLWVCFQVVLTVDVSFGCTWLSPVFFPVPCYGYMFASATFAPDLGLSLATSPRSCRMGLEPLSEAPLCALQPLAPSFLVVLAEATCLRKLLDLSIVLPWP